MAEQRLGYRPALDGFRGVAVLMVLAGHLGIAHLERAATSGVTMFLVLSGFLITTLLLDERATTGNVRLGNFYARRVLRLAPALAAMLIVIGVYAVIDTSVSAPVWFPALNIADFEMGAGRSLGLFAHTWSLSMEEQFYLVWPILMIAALARSRRRAVLLAAVGGASSLAIATILVATDRQGVDWNRVRFSPDTRAYGLFAGCLVALLLPSIVKHARAIAFFVVPAIVACVFASTRTTQSAAEYLLWRPLVVVAAAVLIVSLLDDRLRVTRMLRRRPIAYVGRISYGLYLWHYPIFGILAARLPALAFWPRAGAMVAVSVVVAAASYRFIEAPFLRMQDRFRTATRNRPGESAGEVADHREQPVDIGLLDIA